MASVKIDTEQPEDHSYDYDLVVIGGGSGGLAASKEAALFGKKVACLDFVKPSVQGTQWGLGGTCVNVGCIPKKLIHQASILGENAKEAEHYGWTLANNGFSWDTLRSNVQDHIGSLNWGYRVALRDKKVTYLNALGKFVGPNEVECTMGSGTKKNISARRFVVAVGGRPKYPDIPGKELAISSDDLFSLEKAPGKTLVVGASYIALECAGFLKGLGFDTTVLVRSIFLRGFDQQVANMIGSFMEQTGTKFLKGFVPTSLEKAEDGRIKATWTASAGGGESVSDVFDTVLFATGRDADTSSLGLDSAGVKTDNGGKIIATDSQTSVPHIYAIGDVVKGNPELTPLAIKEGRFLARRLYNSVTLPLARDTIPTTVFTPLEYGCIGLSEEAAQEKFGDDVETYHSFYKPLEWTLPHKEDNVCYCKLICNKADNYRVVGFHVLGDHAGEITQGYAVAMTAGVTKAHFDATVGIHPTSSEEFVYLEVTRSSGASAEKTGC